MPYNFQNHHILALDSCEGLEHYDNIDVCHIYKERYGVAKQLYRLQEALHCKDMSRWYGDWKYRLAEYDTVLISDGIRGRDVVEHINRHNPKARVIIFYLNSVLEHGRNNPKYYKNLNCELYTFDKQNAKDYGIKYKHFYFPYVNQLRAGQQSCIEPKDIFFVGVDKGRLNLLMDLEEQFQFYGLSTNMVIVRQKHKLYYGDKKRRTIADNIPYSEIVAHIFSSKAILDIVQEGQHGMTYRPMEALLSNRKLITNYQEIKEFNFYNPQNIFVLDSGRSLNELSEFINSESIPVAKSIQREYYPEVWLDSFFTS